MPQYGELTTDQPLTILSDPGILRAYENTLATLERCKKATGELEQEIFRRIQARGGTTLPVADQATGELIWTCEQVDSYSYDHSQFTPLLEKFNKTELNKCYFPAHDEPVPAKWDTQKLKAVAKRHGDGAPELVERARVPVGRKLKFERIQGKYNA